MEHITGALLIEYALRRGRVFIRLPLESEGRGFPLTTLDDAGDSTQIGTMRKGAARISVRTRRTENDPTDASWLTLAEVSGLIASGQVPHAHSLAVWALIQENSPIPRLEAQH